MEQLEQKNLELIKELKTIFKKYDITPLQFNTECNPLNKNIHLEILEIMKKYIADGKSKNEIIKHNGAYAFLLNQEKDQTEENREDFEICMIIKYYVNKFDNEFYKITNDGIKLTNIENFEYPNQRPKNEEELENNYKYIKNKFGNLALNSSETLCLLILQDGKTYYTPVDHDTLGHWLNYNGIDINNAIRLETSKAFNDFSFSTLYNYKITNKSDQNKLIKISPEQAKVIGTTYRSLINSWRWLSPLQKSLNGCDGFGFGLHDYDPEYAKHNLTVLSDYSAGFLDDYEYLKELRTTIQNQKDDDNHNFLLEFLQ